MTIEDNILHCIKMNPYISQQEIAADVQLSRSAVAGYITKLIKQGKIKGRAYILNEQSPILCIGGANIDRKAYSYHKLDLYSSNPVAMSESSGGVARNVAENLSKLQAETSLLTCTGNDKDGDWLRNDIKNSGIDVSQMWQLPDERTGNYTAILDTDGEMLISIADMNLYDKMTPDMFEMKWPYIASAQAIFLDTNLSRESLDYMITRHREEQRPLYVDPVSVAKAKKLPEDLHGIHVLFPNKNEAELLADKTINDARDYEEVCQIIRQRGVDKVVMTLGDQGAYYSEAGDSGHIPPVYTEVTDVTGAGDAFTATVIYALTRQVALPKALQMGQVASSLTVQTHKTVSPALSIEKINQNIKEFSS